MVASANILFGYAGSPLRHNSFINYFILASKNKSHKEPCDARHSLEYSIDQFLILFQLHLLVPMFLHQLLRSLLLELHKLEFLAYIFLSSRCHLSSDLQVLHLLDLLLDIGLLNLILNLILYIGLIGVHATSLLPRHRNLVHWEVICDVLVSLNIKLLLILEHFL